MKTVFLSVCEVVAIQEALQHSIDSITDINLNGYRVPVFGGINGDSKELYTEEEAEQAVGLAQELIDTLQKAIDDDCGVIVIEG